MKAIADVPAEEIARRAEATGFSGVVSLSPVGAGVSLDLAFGFADRANRIPNNVETRFAMASGCKIFTAVAVGLLIDEGKLTFDAVLADCVRTRGFHFGDQVTIRQLLNHTSGVPDYFSEEDEEGGGFADLWHDRPCYLMRSVNDFLPLFESGAMKAKPGSGFLYCNSGFILLGLVVEQLTGRDFRDFVAERIFRPCGITRSGYFAMDALPENTALGYIVKASGEWHTNIFSVPAVGGADGGAFTTAGDMRRFWTALLAGRILSRKTLDTFLAPAVPVTERGGTWHYGCGLWLRQERGHWIALVEGSDPGASMESEARPDDGLIATILSNTADGAWALRRALTDMIAAG